MYTEISLENLRKTKLPHIWCAGCGNGIVLGAILRAIERSKIDKDKIVFVSGIGCAGRSSGYVNFNTLHTLHGRPLAFATGIKLASPELKVIVATGDGDLAAIGGNHFIHAAKRNIDMTVVVFNNFTYGMTGGQVSPTTPDGSYTTTTPYGEIEEPMDISYLALASGATYVARETIASPFVLEKYILNGLLHKGFSLIEAVSSCVTEFGRRNSLGDPAAYIKWLKEKSVPYTKVNSFNVKDGIVVGEFVNTKGKEFTEKYYEMIRKVQNEEGN